jgi:hypothetical protein
MQVACSKYVELCVGKEAHNMSLIMKVSSPNKVG